MNYPLISEYVKAIKLSEDNLDKLSYLRPALDADGNPVMSSGNFAVVFKMRDERSGKLHALKCFIKDQECRDEAYKQIADELEYVSSDFITPIKYLEKELFVNSSNSDVSEFPVLLMDWVEGVTLDKYIREHLNDNYALQMISFRFCQMASWLLEQPFAHGDLKPDNILVKHDGTIVMVDYDGMYVPAMKGQRARELGSPDYRHPSRTIDDFDEHIDDFSLATIAMQIYAIALQPNLLPTATGDTLLLTEADYRNLENSVVMHHLRSMVSNAEFANLVGLFYIAFSKSSLLQDSLHAINISRPTKFATISLSTEMTEEDRANKVKDEFGASYSHDWKRLLRVVRDIGTSPEVDRFYGAEDVFGIYYNQPNWRRLLSVARNSYDIMPGTQVICDNAFFECRDLSSITIPDSVTHIGKSAFADSGMLKYVTIPNSVAYIGNWAFSNCVSLESIIVGSKNETYDSRDNCNAIIHTASNTLVAGCKNTIIPASVTGIETGAFSGCASLANITIPASVSHIGVSVFANCSAMSSIEVNSNNKIYDSRENCNAIIHTLTNTLLVGCKNTIIPDSVIQIGNNAFWGCSGLRCVTIPDSVTHIGDFAFYGCKALTELTIYNSVTHIGRNAFGGCSSLSCITIPDSVTYIGESAFGCCHHLNNIIIPNSVKHIGNRAFNGCSRLTSITIPDSVTHIGDSTFCFCRDLTNIAIPNSVTQIGDGAFRGCVNLSSITIPKNITHVGKDVFNGCRSLTEIRIPAGNYDKFKLLLPGWEGKFVEE